MRTTVKQLRRLVRMNLTEVFASRSSTSFVTAVCQVLGLELIGYINSGSYSYVYNVRHQETHQDLILKVSDSRDEYVPYAKIRDVRDKISPDVVKHLPVIVEAFSLGKDPRFKQVISQFEDADTFSIIVTEPLKGLPDAVENQLFGRTHDGKEIPTEDDIHNQVINAFEKAVNKIRVNKHDAVLLDDLFAVIPKKQVISIVSSKAVRLGRQQMRSSNLWSSLTNLWDGVEDELTRRGRGLFKDEKGVRWAARDLGLKFVDAFEKGVSSSDVTTYLTGDWRDQMTTSSVGKSLRKVFGQLSDLGLTPGDLHSGNLMIRPRTGDVVLADVGLFGSSRLPQPD